MHSTLPSPPPYSPTSPTSPTSSNSSDNSPTHSTFLGSSPHSSPASSAPSSPKPFPTRFAPPRYSPRLQHLASLRPLALHLAPPTPMWIATSENENEKSALTMGSAAWIDTAALEAGVGRGGRGGRGALAVAVRAGPAGAAEKAAVLVLLGMGFVVIALLVVGVVAGRF